MFYMLYQLLTYQYSSINHNVFLSLALCKGKSLYLASVKEHKLLKQ